MFIRYLIAFIGAAAITIGLLMFMNGFAQRYVTRDPIQYFRILDFIPAPDRGRQRVAPPSDPRLAPEVPEIEPDPLRKAPALEIGPDIPIEPEILRQPVVPESA